jgi:pimeloyl-ACP methyl ester carboxylesterase
MPVLAIGGDHSYGAAMKTEVEAIASNVQGTVIANSGHWIMEEQPQQATDTRLAAPSLRMLGAWDRRQVCAGATRPLDRRSLD